MRTSFLNQPRFALWCIGAALLLIWSVGILGRGYWTPDEPREADIAWRMSWQSGKAVPSLAGQAFCEKPPLTYWLAGAAIKAFGPQAWAARLPNLLYAATTALAMLLLGRRSVSALAGAAAAAAISTLLLSYQVAIWLATDAPLLAAVSAALYGAYVGFYPEEPGDRWRGYTGMHAALALGFLSKSAVAWMVPALTILALVIWERRWRELKRPELYAGLILQAGVIFSWVWFVHTAPDGDADLKVFFWNNLVGRFAHVDAPLDLQYAAAHRNFPGKYLLELPLYLWPWSLLVVAALRRAWTERRQSLAALRPVRFALAAFVPALAFLSLAATARNIYLAPALPGVALLLGWWVSRLTRDVEPWDGWLMRATAVLLLTAAAVVGVAALLLRRDTPGSSAASGWRYAIVVGVGLLGSAALATAALRCMRSSVQRSLVLLVLSYCMLLGLPASQIYLEVDKWQDLESVGRAIARDAANRPLILMAPDETTRAFIDMYARTSVQTLPGPIDPASLSQLRDTLAVDKQSVVAVQIRGPKNNGAEVSVPPWAGTVGLSAAHLYAIPNGRTYALLKPMHAKPDAALP